jgi:hypothetical protein
LKLLGGSFDPGGAFGLVMTVPETKVNKTRIIDGNGEREPLLSGRTRRMADWTLRAVSGRPLDEKMIRP